MGETGTVPAVPPLWAGKEPGSYEMEVRYVGNYPVSPIFDIEKVAEANMIATVVDGEEVYKA